MASHINPAVTRYKNGVTNADPYNKLFSDYPDADPTRLHVFFDDFDVYNTAKWTVTETQAGATQALTDGDGGLMLLTNSAANNDINALSTQSSPIVLDPTKKSWFKCRMKISDVTNTNFVCGVMNGTIFSLTEGVVFFNAGAGATTLTAQDTTTTSLTSQATMVNDTFMEFAWYYDGGTGASGSGRIYSYIDGVLRGSATILSTDWPNSNSFIVAGIKNLNAVARTGTVDYIFFAQER